MNALEILLIYARQGDGVELIGERRKAFIRVRDKDWPWIWQNGIRYLSGRASGGRNRLRNVRPIMNKMSSIVIPNPCALCKAHYSNVLSDMSSGHLPLMQ